MRILYGVVGEGMGHAMRSAVLLEALSTAGHDVRIVVSGRAADYLEVRYPGLVTRITGLELAYEDNVVHKMKTALKNLKALKGVPANFRRYAEMARDFSPDVVISDFESWTYWFARGQRIPILSVDNMQIIPRCHHDENVIGKDMRDFLLVKGIVRSKLPRCNHYLITTFFYPPVKRDRTTLHPPILRKVILDAKARVQTEDHILVYQSGTSHDSLVNELRRIPVPFRIYGLRRDLTAPEQNDNLTFMPFSEAGFIADLASCRAVIAGGGFTLMGEAIYLGKPMLSVPVGGQFEQLLNASYLRELGYGERANHVTTDVVERFLDRAPYCTTNLGEFEHDQNAGLIETLAHRMEAAIKEGARGDP